jgi:TolA-binding protein
MKVMLYVALVILASVSGNFALKAFHQLMAKARPDTSELERIEPENKAPEPSAETNAAPAQLNAATNSGGATNEISGTNVLAETGSTNGVAESTNTAAAPAQSAPIVSKESNQVPTAMPRLAESSKTRGNGHIAIWSAVFLLSLIGLGLLIASDVSHYFGNKALTVLYNDEGEGVARPEYEAAEQVWANGDHLEAIRLMRDYLNKNPREQYVALRIAEIYEKDLNNNLAAALEYEEVLTKKLPPDRWGWAAIHLCNLYFKLNQEQKGYDLLRRIVNEYGQTPAAEKARKRLEQVDGVAMVENGTEGQVEAPERPPPRTETEPPPSSSNLPPGFRPKK